MMKFLALTLYLLARLTEALILASAIVGCFSKVNFQKGIDLYEILSCFLKFCINHMGHLKNRLFGVEIIARLEKLGTCFV